MSEKYALSPTCVTAYLSPAYFASNHSKGKERRGGMLYQIIYLSLLFEAVLLLYDLYILGHGLTLKV